jgi:hypothetical protein
MTAEASVTLFGVRPFVLAMAGRSPRPSRTDKGAPKGNGGGWQPRKVAQWAGVVGPIAGQVLGAVVILYEVLERVNSPAALGVGLTLAIGGKFADVVSELMKPGGGE